ncbi:hypothetical protein LTR84_000187 [Exophiala bonariae]|uniref:Major facilitator superfamily (MFS) profile domain-containing protein n=1 Tax=Exophiala bonariae TaxID=1690606 RepID=A0AAV9NRM7_9EURO|nr:hypothetical protein LTR84_000187 [Exophiala bonariae]
MPFALILDDVSLAHVPGTVILDDAKSTSQVVHQLKHGTGRNRHVVLVPQPSEDVNDPLNWSTGKKLAAYLVTLFGTCLYAGCTSPLLNAGLLVIAGEFKVGIMDVALLAGEQMLVVGVTSPFVLALARKYGKRPIYLFSSIMAVIGTVVCQTANEFPTLRAGRVVQGFSVTAYESIVFASVGDLFFVHERGLYLAATNFMFAGISSLVSVISGPIVDNLGWRYQFHIFLAAVVLQTILQFFFVPETTYRRDVRYNIGTVVEENLEELAVVQAHNMEDKGSIEHTEAVPATKKRTFRQGLALYRGKYSDENLLQLWIATFAVNLNLAVFLIAILQAFFASLLVAVAISIAQLFGLPPYSLTTAQIGYMYLGPFIGAIIGLVFFGLVQDPLAKYLSRKNNGVYEPEYRLLLSVLSLSTSAGLFAFGYLTGSMGTTYACSAVYGIVIFGVIGCLATTSSYIMDAFHDMSAEIFIVGNCFKNFVFYGMSHSINTWLAQKGPQKVFFTLGGIALGMMVIVPIMYVFGKKYRSFWARHNLLNKWHIRTHEY